MAKKITNEMILEALNGIKAEVNEMRVDINSIGDRVGKLEKGAKTVPSVKGKGNATASAKAEKTAKFSTNLKDYEPKKSADGNYNWASYKAKRKDYCYAVATNGQALGCYVNGKKVFDYADIEDAYNKAKAQFSKKFVYKKVADR